MARLGRVVVEAIATIRRGAPAPAAHPFLVSILRRVMASTGTPRGSPPASWARSSAGGAGEWGWGCSLRRPRPALAQDARRAAGGGRAAGFDGAALRGPAGGGQGGHAAVRRFDLYLHGLWSPTTAAGPCAAGHEHRPAPARRYHGSARTPVVRGRAHSANEGPPQGTIVNLTDPPRRALAPGAGGACAAPRLVLSTCAARRGRPPWRPGPRPRPRPRPRTALPPRRNPLLPHLQLPAHHEVLRDEAPAPLHGTLAAAAEPRARRLPGAAAPAGRGRAHVERCVGAEVIHGAPCRFTDPARFSWRPAARTATRPGAAEGLRRDPPPSCGPLWTAPGWATRQARGYPRLTRRRAPWRRPAGPSFGRSSSRRIGLASYGAGRCSPRRGRRDQARPAGAARPEAHTAAAERRSQGQHELPGLPRRGPRAEAGRGLLLQSERRWPAAPLPSRR
jgi:hypothetical protein